MTTPHPDAIAVIGLACRFPGADDVTAYWRNLLAGVDSVTGADGGSPARGLLDGPEAFDAEFFGFSPLDAERTDPQHRLLLECAWLALEHAGHGGPDRPTAGVFAGSATSTHLLDLLADERHRTGLDDSQLLLACDKDYLATRVAHRLNLRGPAVVVQSSCSTSLLAVHLAAQSVLAGECDLALAGGVCVRGRRNALGGPGDREDGMTAPDGRCRAFDADATGMVPGDGVGVVVLRRLEDALRAGDRVHAVLLGSAVNNDGAAKIGYAAPSVEGQAAVIRDAWAVAGVDPATAGFVEAHGTGTRLGDPIEVAALTEALGPGGPCALGSVKTNIGHLDAAAGVASLIKAVLAVEHGVVPPNLHFTRPNPHLGLERTRFRVPVEVTPFPGAPRRAGVSSFGIGGTNVHVVLEQAPPRQRPADAAPQVVTVSARSPEALAQAAAATAAALADTDGADFADAAFTLRSGRTAFDHRIAVVAATGARAAELLASARPGEPGEPAPVAFLLPGQGTQHAGMAAGLRFTDPVFAEAVDAGVAAVAAHGLDLAPVLLGEDPDGLLARTDVAQAALFVVERALVRLWEHWGVRPAALLGHSIGELVAAHVAGVLDLDDAAALVLARGRAMAAAGPGAMLAVALPEAEAARLCPPGVEVAAVNAPAQTVLSGPAEAVREAAGRCAAAGARVRELPVGYAFHSAAVEPAAGAVTAAASELVLRAPALPVLSNVTGRWLTEAQATDPRYWGAQVRAAVRFTDCVRTLADRGPHLFVEAGPGRTLADLVRAHSAGRGRVAGGSLPHRAETHPREQALTTAAALWADGVPVRWSSVHPGRGRVRAALPGYPFQRRHFGLTPAPATPTAPVAPVEAPDPAPGATAVSTVTDLFRRLLGVEVVGPHDSFFALGGHSLLGMRLLDEIKAAYGVSVPIADLYDNATPAHLAALVGDADAAPGAVPAGDGDQAPLSFTQERFWLRQQAMPEDTAAAVLVPVRLRGPLDRDALARACAALPARHPVLRSRFVEVDGVPRQREAAPELPLRHAVAADHAALERLAAAEAGRPFDLAAEPPVRALLAASGEEEHVLLLTLHHIATDAASNAVLLADLAAAYTAARTGADTALPPAPSFADHARAERARGVDADTERHWRALFADVPTSVDLPVDHAVPAGTPVRSARFTTTVPFAALRRYCADTGTPLFAGLLAAFQAVVHRWSGMPEFLVGTPVTGRAAPGTAELVGPLFTAVAVRADLTGDPDFAEAVRRARAATATALRHASVPPERYLPAGSRRGAPYDVLFALQTAAAPRALELGELRAEPLELGNGTAQCALTLSAVPDGDTLRLLVDYDAARFTRRTVDLVVGHFATLVSALPTHPGVPVDAVPMAGEEETAALTAAATGAEPVLAGVPVLTRLVADQVARTPDAPAVRCGGQALTYRELGERYTRQAAALAGHGVRPGDVVGVCLDRGVDLVVAVLAVLAAGAAFLPLDPAHPLERRLIVLRDSGARFAITGTTPASRLPDAPVPCLDLASLVPAAGAVRLPDVRPQDVAYVIYTSGSTGTPKGVAVAHEGVAVDLAWRRDVSGLGPGDRLLHTVSAAFDPSVWQLFGPLVTGAELVVTGPEEAADPTAVVRLVREHRITVADFVPGQLARVLDAAGPDDLTSLRLVFCGGERLARDLAERFHARTGAALRNQYGPTEATIDTTSHLLVPGDRGEVPIGSPVHGKRLRLLDRRLRPVPARVTGELWIGGHGLAHAYVGRAAETADRFRPDPFGPPGARMYRSGDLARFRHDGLLEFAGRADHQVKVNGVRIEPDEVAAALRTHPDVRDAAVVARTVGGGRALVAYVVPAREGLSPIGVRGHVAGLLPTAFVPSAVVPVDRLPLGPTGKLDVAALPDVPAGAEATGRLPEPGTVEDEVAALWRALLNRPQVPVDVDFFALGGDSLLAMRLVAGLRERFDVALSLPDVLAAGTVEGLVARLGNHAAPDTPGPLLRRTADRVPLSWAQEQVLALGPDVPEEHRVLHLAVPLGAEVDTDVLVRALDAVVARHEALRAAVDGDTQTVVAPYSPLSAEPLDPAAGRLLTAGLARLDTDEHLLSLSVHRAAVDGTSVGVLAADLGELHRALAAGEAPALPPLTVHHPDFAAWERSWLTPGLVADAARRWRRAHPWVDAVRELPRPRGATRLEFTAEVPADRLRALRALAHDRGRTLRTVVLAAWAHAVARELGPLPICVPVANRDDPRLLPALGRFVNLAVLPVPREPADFAARLDRTYADALAAYRDQRLLPVAALERAVSGTDGPGPVFPIMFDLAEGSTAGGAVPGITEMPREHWTDFGLALLAHPVADRLELVMLHAPEVHDAGRARALWTTLLTTLDAAVDPTAVTR